MKLERFYSEEIIMTAFLYMNFIHSFVRNCICTFKRFYFFHRFICYYRITCNRDACTRSGYCTNKYRLTMFGRLISSGIKYLLSFC